MQWSSDLIGYDALNSYGSPSYYAQVMFASCLGDHTLDSSVSGAGDKFFYSVTSSPDKVCLKLVNAGSAEQPVEIALNGLPAGTSYGPHRYTDGKYDLGDQHHHPSRAHRARQVHHGCQGRTPAAPDAPVLDSGRSNRPEIAI